MKEEARDFFRVDLREEDQHNSSCDSHDSQDLAQQQFERLDSRGKKMVIRQIVARQEERYQENGQTVYSIACVNLEPSTYLSFQEMRDRAQSLAHSQYKMEKRAYAKHVAKKRVLWMMAVVKCKLFAKKLKEKWLKSKELKELQDYEEENNLLINMPINEQMNTFGAHSSYSNQGAETSNKK